MDPQSVGLQKVTLRKLEPDLNNALIVGIIIAKQRPRRFANARNDTSNKDRAVWNFTLRDSPQDYINVTVWGTGDDIFKLNDTFQTGNIVEVVRPKIAIRKGGDYGEQFRPMVTSPYMLTVNENQSQVLRHEGRPYNFTHLLRLPTKPMAGFVTLADIQNGGPTRVGEFVDLLVAVKSVGVIRSIKTKDGIEQQVRDLMVLDHTTPGVKISIWDPELMIRVGFWKPRYTILFMTDMKIDFSNFYNALMPIITTRTIITENPEGPEAEIVRNYAVTAPLEPNEMVFTLASSINPDTIQNVMSIQQVLDKIAALSSNTSARTEDRHFTALLYVFVTHLDLDGLSRVISTRCNRCKRLVASLTNACENQDCPVGMGSESEDNETSFDLRVNLSDHTGTLNFCRLTGQTAETILNCTVDEFTQIPESEKCRLKWKYLMERCAIRIMVLCVSNKKPVVSILSCTLASPTEVANRLPHY